MNPQFKRNLLSLAGLGVFLFLALGSYFSTNTNNSNNNGNIGAKASVETKVYTNSRSQFKGKLASNFVDFSFNYPGDWKIDPKAGTGDSPNFVKVEKTNSDEITLENFAVGYFTGQKAVMPQLAKQLDKQFSGSFPEYKKVSEGETRLGQYDGYEFRFTSHSEKSAKGPLEIWGRVVLLPGDTNRKGAAIVMLATSQSEEVKGPQDVGEKGELPIVVSSFKFGS